MTNQEQYTVNQETHIASNARVLDALRKAAGGLVGVTVEVIIDASEIDNAMDAVKTAELSGERESGRRMIAGLALRPMQSGGFIKNTYESDNPESLRNVYAWQAISLLANQGESMYARTQCVDELSPKRGTDVGLLHATAFLSQLTAAENLEYLHGIEKEKAREVYEEASEHLKGVEGAYDVNLEMQPYDITD